MASRSTAGCDSHGVLALRTSGSEAWLRWLLSSRSRLLLAHRPGLRPARDAEAHRQVRLAAWHPHARTKDGHPSVCHVTRHWLVRSSRSSCHPDGAEHCSLSNAFATKTDDESTRSPAAECRSCAMAESMRYKTFIISARDSSHKYTSQGVGRGCRTFYTNVR